MGVPISSRLFDRRSFPLSSVAPGEEVGAAFGFAVEGGVTGMLGAVRGTICLGELGEGIMDGVGDLVNGICGRAVGRCAGVKLGNDFVTDSG
jgi:hypothetical protein